MNKSLFLLLSCLVAYCSVNAMEQTNPLHAAAKAGDIEQVRTLLGQGAGVNRQDNDGRTPLFMAVLIGNQPIVQLLLEQGAHVNLQDKLGRTPLHWAVSSNHQAIVSLLLGNGADVTLQDIDGMTPLQLAYALGVFKIAKLIEPWLKSWLAVSSVSRAERLAFCMAMHPDAGANSPAKLLNQYLLREICSHVTPQELMHDPRIVEDYKRMYNYEQQKVKNQSHSSCVIS